MSVQIRMGRGSKDEGTQAHFTIGVLLHKAFAQSTRTSPWRLKYVRGGGGGSAVVFQECLGVVKKRV